LLFFKFYFASIDSHPASSSSAHFSSSKWIKLGAGAGAGFGSGLGFDGADEFVFPVFFEDVGRVAVADNFELGSSFNHDSKLRSRCFSEISLFDCDCC
jgi:hypothetical protein